MICHLVWYKFGGRIEVCIAVVLIGGDTGEVNSGAARELLAFLLAIGQLFVMCIRYAIFTCRICQFEEHPLASCTYKEFQINTSINLSTIS